MSLTNVNAPISLFAFTADCHLLPNAWVNRREISGDAYFSFTQIVDYCIRKKIPLVIGGDLFDSKRPDSESVAVFIAQTCRMRDSQLPVYVIQGDHDITDPPWPVAICPDAVHHVNGRHVNIGGVRVFGLDYQPRGQLQEKLKEVPDATDVLITHQGWQEFQGIGVTEGSLATDIPFPVTVLSGDYHAEKTYESGPEKGIIAFSPGSTCMQALGEPAEKSFLEVIQHDNGKLVIRRVPLATRLSYSFEIETPGQLHELLVLTLPGVVRRAVEYTRIWELPPQIASPLVRIRYRDDIPEAVKLIRANEAAGRCHLFLEPQHAVDDVCVPFERSAAGAFESLLSACRQLSPSEGDFNMIQRLLRTDDSDLSRELEAMRQEFLNASNSP